MSPRQSVRRMAGPENSHASRRRSASAIAQASAAVGSWQWARKPLSTHGDPPRRCPTTAHPPAWVWEHQDASKARRRGARGGRFWKDNGKEWSFFRVCLRLLRRMGTVSGVCQGSRDKGPRPAQMGSGCPGRVRLMRVNRLVFLRLTTTVAATPCWALAAPPSWLQAGGTRSDAERGLGADRHRDLDRPSVCGGSWGSGLFLSKDGLVATNTHVIEKVRRIAMVRPDGRQALARVMGIGSGDGSCGAKRRDPCPFPDGALGNPETLSPGAWVIAMGNPYGLGRSVSVKILSARGREIGSRGLFDNHLQTDAAINRGNSVGRCSMSRGGCSGLTPQSFRWRRAGASAGASCPCLFKT